MEARTVLKYPGSKWRLADWIVSLMPPHKSYLEPFFGSGAVFFKKTPSRIETINDLDGEIVNLFRVIRERSEELERAVVIGRTDDIIHGNVVLRASVTVIDGRDAALCYQGEGML